MRILSSVMVVKKEKIEALSDKKCLTKFFCEEEKKNILLKFRNFLFEINTVKGLRDLEEVLKLELLDVFGWFDGR